MKIALTLGEPAGIGPDIAILAAQHAFSAEIVVVGSPDLLQQRAQSLGLSLTLTEFNPQAPAIPNGRGKLSYIPVALKAPVIPGVLNPRNSEYVLETLKIAVSKCMNQNCSALVTGPVHKEIIARTQVPFTGHTQYLAELTNTDKVLMSFYTPEVIVGLATTHVPLKNVSQQLHPRTLYEALLLFNNGLKHLFQKTQPKILVCGLNPHAGEGGLLGSEEEEIIIPILNQLKHEGICLEGPHSGDTAFSPEKRKAFDGIFAMYHDQGLAPIKALYYGNIVNVTMGLPFLRTSVDHGTALDIAGKQRPSETSLLKAIQVATGDAGKQWKHTIHHANDSDSTS